MPEKNIALPDSWEVAATYSGTPLPQQVRLFIFIYHIYLW